MSLNIKRFLNKEWIIKNLFALIVLILLFIFDVVVLISLNNYYRKPFISKNYIRENAYTTSLVRNGFALVDKKYYYCDEKAEIVKDQIIEWNEQKYYLDIDGALVTNKKNYKIKDKYYDINGDGALSIVK